ncbi:hypothetical protein AY601_1777 [Pedobacter cryoconitis]|uniref:Uncharacterized protein n=1 Tax=Pedobacter cryoconitis TaxID=188932 RepID=A0A127VBU3_9SPHI|nr:hypothetical protein AY601_1777 [Pedobacter cryoconitis]
MIIKRNEAAFQEQPHFVLMESHSAGGKEIRTRYTFHESMSPEFNEILVVIEIVLLICLVFLSLRSQGGMLFPKVFLKCGLARYSR